MSMSDIADIKANVDAHLFILYKTTSPWIVLWFPFKSTVCGFPNSRYSIHISFDQYSADIHTINLKPMSVWSHTIFVCA